MSIASIDPATGRTLRQFDALDAEEIERRLALAETVFQSWRRTAFAHRAECLRAAAGILDAESTRFGELMTLEMGKPLKAAVGEAAKCAVACRFFADHAESFLADVPVTTEGGASRVVFQPLGAVLAVMPWNFPFWQVFRFAAPALMAGNVGLLKHASNVPQCALAIEEIFSRAGVEPGVFQTLLIPSSAVDAIIADPRVAAVALTGSEGAGRSVASQAGRNLKKTVLELGGSDPFIVMPSADIDRALARAVEARVINNGQSCIAAKRFVVHEAIYDRFLGRFVDAMRKLRVGNPMDETTQLGPLATSAIRDDLHRQVQETLALGGRLLTGGKPLDGEGYYYEPTVIDQIPPDSPSAGEELFGPVAAVFRANSAHHAVRIANSVRFGLGASAWTRDCAEQDYFVSELESGLVFINEMVASDPRLPFGGVKSSGYGRELSDFGIREFVNVKSVRIQS